MTNDDTEHTFRHRTSHYDTALERRRHADDCYDVWSDNDDLDVLPTHDVSRSSRRPSTTSAPSRPPPLLRASLPRSKPRESHAR